MTNRLNKEEFDKLAGTIKWWIFVIKTTESVQAPQVQWCENHCGSPWYVEAIDHSSMLLIEGDIDGLLFRINNKEAAYVGHSVYNGNAAAA